MKITPIGLLFIACGLMLGLPRLPALILSLIASNLLRLRLPDVDLSEAARISPRFDFTDIPVALWFALAFLVFTVCWCLAIHHGCGLTDNLG